jgi:hypothetical protein
MKNTMLWSALFTVICTQVQAEAATEATPVTNTTTVTQTVQPATPPTAPVPTTPVAIQPAALIINCDYKIPETTKVVEQSLVLSWSEKATNQAFDLDPNTLDAQLLKLQSCFTEQGWIGFNNALQQSGNLTAIKTQKLMVSSQVDGPSQMLEIKENEWKIALPLQVVYQNDKEKVTQLLNVNLKVGRKPNGDLGITQMITSPRAPASAQQDANPAVTPPATNTTASTTPVDVTSAPTTSTNNGTPTTPTPLPEATLVAPDVTTPQTETNTNNNTPIDQPKPQSPTVTTTPAP